MFKVHFFIIGILLAVFAITYSQTVATGKNQQEYLQAYHKANRLFREAEEISDAPDYSEKKEEEMNRQALELFGNLLQRIRNDGASEDSLEFHINFKIGVLEHYFDNLNAAEKGYSQALALAQRSGRISESFLFKPYLYLGIILYNQGHFDSALSLYRKAERIAAANPGIEETERLYNTLGVLYYETGNYEQAKNYMEKSVALLPKNHPYYLDFLVNYKINLASTLTKLEEFGEALEIYQSILPHKIHSDIIRHNTGIINLNLGSVRTALEYFRQVNPQLTNPARLYNDMALAFYNLSRFDSAYFYLGEADRITSTEKNKSITRGQTHKIRGDVLVAEKREQEAIHQYHKAIIQFFPAFNENEIASNPGDYTGVFSYINLFNTLTAKADAFNQVYANTREKTALESALNAYQSAFRLADYVERTYDSDEARLFLNKNKYLVHSKPIDISLQLYDLTQDEIYLQDAYSFDQRNKGSVISLGIFENELNRTRGEMEDLLEEERTLRSSITRLSMKAAKVADSTELNAINASIRDYEIQLGKLQETMQSRSHMGAGDRIPSINEMQQEKLDKQTAFISYHLSGKDLVTFCITRRATSYRRLPLTDSFFVSIEKYINALHDLTNSRQQETQQLAGILHGWLIRPIAGELQAITRLIINPDDELNFLPFEALQSPQKNYLVENYAVQYVYSAETLNWQKKKIKTKGVLSFAPFAYTGSGGNDKEHFEKLSYSGIEISGLAGKSFYDRDATRSNFILYANRYPLVHLATHAVVNNKSPVESYIAFYPVSSDSTTYRLYAGEIYNMRLDSTSLIILSACETGAGELVKGEGLMSLSRAFAYAGCPNIVTSLWKAEDRSTAFVTRKLHQYLEEDYPADRALQLAKLDLLRSTDIDPRLKNPNYWAHLLYIGSYEKRSGSYFWLWAVIITVAVTITIFLMKTYFGNRWARSRAVNRKTIVDEAGEK